MGNFSFDSDFIVPTCAGVVQCLTALLHVVTFGGGGPSLADTSNINRLDDFFRNAKLRVPAKQAVTIWLSADMLEWLRKQGKGYQTRINQLIVCIYGARRNGSNLARSYIACRCALPSIKKATRGRLLSHCGMIAHGGQHGAVTSNNKNCMYQVLSSSLKYYSHLS